MDDWLNRLSNLISEARQALCDDDALLAFLDFKLHILCEDVEPLIRHGEYQTSHPREIDALLSVLYTKGSYSKIQTLVLVEPMISQSRNRRGVLGVVLQPMIQAAARRTDEDCIFVVDDWLRFIADDFFFRAAKDLTLSGAEVRVRETPDDTIIPGCSFVIFSVPAERRRCVVLVEADNRNSASTMLTLRTGWERTEQSHQTFQAFWTSAKSQILKKL